MMSDHLSFDQNSPPKTSSTTDLTATTKSQSKKDDGKVKKGNFCSDILIKMKN